MTEQLDILVIGGGPAGCALARSVKMHRPELRVAVLERSDYQGQRVGETLPPQTRTLLERLGLWEDFGREGHLPAFGAKSVWGSAHVEDKEFMTSIERNGWHLDRNRFDAFMACMAEEVGVEFHRNAALKSASRADGGWNVEVEGAPLAHRAKVLVDATGRKASLARMLGAEVSRYDRLVGTMAILEAASLLDRDTLVESCPEGWWYSALLPGKKMAVAFFCDAPSVRALRVNQADGWKAQLAKAAHTSHRLEGLLESQPLSLQTWPAHSQRLHRPIGEDWLAVGDAAAAFDPLSSQGIFFALRSALMGAFAALDLLKGGEPAREAVGKYSNDQWGQFSGYWELRRDFYRMEARWPEQDFWRSRHGHLWLEPETWIAIASGEHSRPRFFSPSDLASLAKRFPEGGPARTWMEHLRDIRPDLPAGQALEGLQTLIDDGHALSNPQAIPSP